MGIFASALTLSRTVLEREIEDLKALQVLAEGDGVEKLTERVTGLLRVSDVDLE